MSEIRDVLALRSKTNKQSERKDTDEYRNDKASEYEKGKNQ